MFQWFLRKPDRSFAPLKWREVWKYYRMKREYNKPKAEDIPISDEDFEFLLRATRTAREQSKKPAFIFQPHAPVEDSDWDGSMLGSIQIAEANFQWPTIEDERMLPVLQLRIDDLPTAPDRIQKYQYLLVWCGAERSVNFEGDLSRKFLEIAMFKGEKAVLKFAAKHKDKMTIEILPDPNKLRVHGILRGTSISRETNHPNKSPFLPHTIRFDKTDDYVQTADGMHLQFADPADINRLEMLTDQRELTSKQYKQLDESPIHCEQSKLGGWPTWIQYNPEDDPQFEHVLQIASDRNLEMMFGDLGVLYIGMNPQTDEWAAEWACY
jgi:uncharacterized protein DUF1963